MTSRSIVTLVLVYVVHGCFAVESIDFESCMGNINDTINKYSSEYEIYLQRKYNWIYEVAVSYKDKLPLLPGYDPEDPQLCDEIDYTYQVFQQCGGMFIDDSTYKPDFQYFLSGEDICKWLASTGSEFYIKSNKNKQVKNDCNFDNGLDLYNYQHGLCYKEHMGTQ